MFRRGVSWDDFDGVDDFFSVFGDGDGGLSDGACGEEKFVGYGAGLGDDFGFFQNFSIYAFEVPDAVDDDGAVVDDDGGFGEVFNGDDEVLLGVADDGFGFRGRVVLLCEGKI